MGAVSGYGRRASRALCWLAVVVIAATAIFSTVGTSEGKPATDCPPTSVALATGTINYPPYERNVGSVLVFSLRSGIALLREPDSTAPLTVPGEITHIVLRLTVPVLLALVVLAIRGRIKR